MGKGMGIIALLLVANIAFSQSDVINEESTPQNLSIESQKVVQPTKADDAATKNQAVEKIEVTGSHIRRIDVEGPSPIMTIDKDALARSGYNSVSDVLRDIGANSFGSFKEHGAFVGSGTATVNLRGVGEQRTLVLLNGKRLPTDALNGAVDLNMIPMAAVERVDILKDGASATYGSDALGGVVNIITKKNFEGVEVNGNASIAELGGGDRRDLSLTYGYFGDKVRSTNVVFMRQNTRIYARDRQWSKIGMSQTGSPGSYTVGGVNKHDPDCEAEGGIIVPAPGNNGTRCSYNIGSRNTEMPDLYQTSFFSDNEIDINGTSSVYARLGYSYKKDVWQVAPAVAAGSAFKTTAPTNKPTLGADQGQDIVTRYRLTEAGDRIQDSDTNAGNVMVGYKKELGDSWQIDSSMSYNRIWRVAKRTGGYVLQDKYIEKLKNGVPVKGGFNPIAGKGQRGDLSDIKYVPRKETLSDLGMLNVNADGELGSISSGPIAMAVGIQATKESFLDFSDEQSLAGNVLGLSTSNGGGGRTTGSTYSEVSIPLASNLESQIALRYDYYSDFGSTINPKMGFRWGVTDKLVFRTSAGTGFRAPAMQDLYQAASTSQPQFVDHVLCKAANYNPSSPDCQPRSYNVSISGNDKLQEEKSFSANFGALYQFTRDQSAGLDLWFYNLTDLVGINYEDLTRAEANGSNVAGRGVTVDRDPTNREIQNIDAPLQNLSSTEVFGVDFNYLATYKTVIGDFGMNLNHSHLAYFKEEGFPGAGKRNKLGEAGKPAWRNNTAFYYFPNNRNEVSVLARTSGAHDKVVRAAGKQPIYTEYDLRYALKVFKGMGRITLQVRNFLNTIPPADDSNPLDPDLNYSIYDERGRQFVLGYRHMF